ncbi:MAG: leucyl aminopeptidase [Proteobacteria bacterium]|nr:leucyl aminopeptidase [Pseudomonadota bacterium]
MLTIGGIKDAKRKTADLMAIYLFEGSKTHDLSAIPDAKTKKKIEAGISNFEFKGKSGESLVLEGSEAIKRILLIGLGKKGNMSADKVRGALDQAVKNGNRLKVGNLVSAVPAAEKYLVNAVEGALLSSYQFDGFYQKKDKDKANTLQKLDFITTAKAVDKIVNDAKALFSAVNRSKDLVNTPSNIVTPTYLEQEAKEIAKGNKKVKLTVLNEKDAEKLKMYSFLSVGRGSAEPSKMIILNYTGNPKSKQIYGVLGKGITFDSGGISIKPGHGMWLMKADMAGSAAALGVFRAVTNLGLKINLITIVAAAENMPGSKAYKPGDVITASNGKTIEVTNTDAEGRMVLADALVYAQKLGATKLIDIATLTGACIVSFGNVHTAVMSNSQEWAEAYLNSAKQSGEKAWQLPMDDEYNDLLKSDICDMINANENRKAGTIIGGKFLEKFIEKNTEWIHLDIAGTAYLDAPSGYLHKNATAVPVRTIVDLLQKEAKGKK